MKTYLLHIGALLMSLSLYSQVGIGTTSPSPAAMLEVSSRTNGAGPYKGIMPPRVPDITARDGINTVATDEGLLVYVESLGCLQVFNGSGWESVHCVNTIGFSNLFQNFDLNTTWGYSSDVAFFNNGTKGFYGITNSSNGGFSNITTLTNNFLGILDLNDAEDGNGTTGFATITFNTVDVSAATSGVTISFDYDFFEYDGGDEAHYTVIIDNVPQTEVTLITGTTDLSLTGSISENVPGGTTLVALRIRIKQNGQTDYAGFDNFALIAN